ncbi:PREDICTED: uncharacterized protein LOC105954140 [Erythranthe guttata]|uniref:uncharacterized protein LOC105954140 n=1 Tax=Erythranthe guttata TaxID=4155 RepID=UPI00064DA375|nr:PREDICTED: uncharacterized protein LOC105954140 [Erythranthe guttata]|eukprot:XP_012833268.1 PREDICTED: uncharacterized protein LOC105954140 [Erythranthe guttata]
MVLAGRAIKIEMRCQNTKENSNQFSALPKPIRSGYWASEIQEMANEESTRHSKAGRAIKAKMKFWKFPRSNQDQEWQSVFSIAKVYLVYWQCILGLDTLIRKSKKLLVEIHKPL